MQFRIDGGLVPYSTDSRKQQLCNPYSKALYVHFPYRKRRYARRGGSLREIPSQVWLPQWTQWYKGCYGISQGYERGRLSQREDPFVLSFEVKPWKDEDPEHSCRQRKTGSHRAWAICAAVKEGIMKIVILDGYTENPGDLSWEGFWKNRAFNRVWQDGKRRGS